MHSLRIKLSQTICDRLRLPQIVRDKTCHGDLWSGNNGRGRIGGKGPVEEVVFDPSACYAHSEYELGIMQMFGGFGSLKEYHELCPKTQPVDEYRDRVKLYEYVYPLRNVIPSEHILKHAISG